MARSYDTGSPPGHLSDLMRHRARAIALNTGGECAMPERLATSREALLAGRCLGRARGVDRVPHEPSTNRAFSVRSISYGDITLTPTAMQAFGIFIFFLESDATSWLTTMSLWACA